MGQIPSASARYCTNCHSNPIPPIYIVKTPTIDTGTQCESDEITPSISHRSSIQDHSSSQRTSVRVSPIPESMTHSSLDIRVNENYIKPKFILPPRKACMNEGDACSSVYSESEVHSEHEYEEEEEEDFPPKPGRGVIVSLPDGCKVISHGAAIHKIRPTAPTINYPSSDLPRKVKSPNKSSRHTPRVNTQTASSKTTARNMNTLQKNASEKHIRVVDLRKYGATTPRQPQIIKSPSEALKTPQTTKLATTPRLFSYKSAPRLKVHSHRNVSAGKKPDPKTPVVRIRLKDVEKSASNLKTPRNREYLNSDLRSSSEITARTMISQSESTRSMDLLALCHNLSSILISKSRDKQETQRELSKPASAYFPPALNFIASPNALGPFEPQEIQEGEEIKKVPTYEFSFIKPSIRRSKSHTEIKQEDSEMLSCRFDTLQEEDLNKFFALNDEKRNEQQTPQLVIK